MQKNVLKKTKNVGANPLFGSKTFYISKLIKINIVNFFSLPVCKWIKVDVLRIGVVQFQKSMKISLIWILIRKKNSFISECVLSVVFFVGEFEVRFLCFILLLLLKLFFVLQLYNEMNSLTSCVERHTLEPQPMFK